MNDFGKRLCTAVPVFAAAVSPSALNAAAPADTGRKGNTRPNQYINRYFNHSPDIKTAFKIKIKDII